MKMRVAMIASEMTPFAKTGGLADVVGALPAALAKQGPQVHLYLPRYSSIQEKGSLCASQGIQVHFVEHEGYFGRSGLYGDQGGDYPDNLERFSFFCRRALDLMREENLIPDLIHAHDWQAALGLVYLNRMRAEGGPFSKTGAIFTIHNLAYQGIFPKEEFPRLDLPWGFFSMEALEYYNRVNLLKGGLVFSDRITTVSPTYARQIQTPEYGEGLEGVLQARAKDLTGILNGIDQGIWDPAADPFLSASFDAARPEGKVPNKLFLQRQMHLQVDEKIPVIGMVTRLASQKGVDLVVEALPRLASLGAQLVIVGSGDRPIEEALQAASLNAPWIGLSLSFDERLAHQIYAGADLFLMPSRYEPCGLGQMIAMRYGAVPLVRQTGGLADTVFEASSDGSQGNGFCFQEATPQDLFSAAQRALELHRRPLVWQKLMKRGMAADFSWEHSAKEYIRLYEEVVSARLDPPLAVR